MNNKQNKSLIHIKGKTGFIVAKVQNEIQTYDQFINIISRDSRVRTTIDPKEQKWYSQSETKGNPNKLGIAMNYPVLEAGVAKFYEFAFQAKDLKNNTIMSGLYKGNRPMFGFGWDYRYWDDKFFVIALGVDINSEKLDNTINKFFNATKLKQDRFTSEMIKDFDKNKDGIVKTIEEAHKHFRKFNNFKKIFCYEILQGYHLFDRFISLGDYGM